MTLFFSATAFNNKKNTLASSDGQMKLLWTTWGSLLEASDTATSPGKLQGCSGFKVPWKFLDGHTLKLISTFYWHRKIDECMYCVIDVRVVVKYGICWVCLCNWQGVTGPGLSFRRSSPTRRTYWKLRKKFKEKPPMMLCPWYF